jgi:hypothetical protein
MCTVAAPEDCVERMSQIKAMKGEKKKNEALYD